MALVKQTVKCPVCGRPTSVNLDGKLRKHKAVLQTWRRFGVWCENRFPSDLAPER